MNYGRKAREADEAVRRWLESSGIPTGGRLPSERQLARQLDIPHSVMNRAMNRALAEGRVERRGYRIFRSADLPAAPLSFPVDLVILQRSKRLASLRKVAHELGFPLREHLSLSAEELEVHLSTLDTSTTGSVILVPPPGGETAGWGHAAQKLVREGLAVICVGQRFPGLSSVASDRGLEQVVRRLAALGHIELALLVASPWTATFDEMTAHWTALCHRFASESSRGRVIYQNSSQLLREDLLAIADQLNTEWKSVSALVISTDDELPIQRLLDVFRRHKIAVPDRLSLVSLSDHPALQTALPPVASALDDHPMEHEIALLLARRSMRVGDRLGLPAAPVEIDVAVSLVERRSLIPCPPVAAAEIHPAAPAHHPAFQRLSFDDATAAGQVRYGLTKDAPEERFRCLDLTRRVNRPLNFRRGWLGDLPLTSLPPGLHTFHGVPFQILGGPTRRHCGAVVFQSLRNTKGRTAMLPSRVRIPVHARASAIYILHGCGYVKHRARFASYTFVPRKGRPETLPLVALGQPRPGAETWELAESISEANIQDWWPDYPHCNFRHSRMVPLADTRSAGPVRGQVYLYTLEWINPAPHDPVRHIEIEVDPEQSTTLGVLAITVLTSQPLTPASVKTRAPRSAAKIPPPGRR